MRKAHKQEMLTLLKTMGKMADLLPKLADPAEQIQDCLAACLCLKENLEGENAPGSLNLLQTIETSLKENNLNILEHVEKLETLFNSETKAKQEALFLPYKASMWDSLESIYSATKNDPNWDAFVMPIPYYDKKDGKLTEQHWETCYPKNIPLIDYRKYNIEERQPNIIFIHNPYDGYNIVTNVEPDFYSERLRNLTDCLVYVPYFVGNGINIEEHFCTLPACIFAHKVIVQTEQERKIYIKTYKEFAKRNRVPERFEQIESKFLALGSPKLDKAIDAKIEDYEVPPEWEKLLNNKKIVFYNTSISTLLEYSVEDNKPSNKYLQKIKSVFEFFKNQKDAILLWRPHPLLESTIKSMRPWLWQEYAEIVNEYKASSYGIYDDSTDLNRAIALSDIYYGDGSSVTLLFEATGKQFVFQLFDGQIFFSGIYACKNTAWFIDCNNMLYKHNKQSEEIQCIGKSSNQNWAHSGIAENNKKLYFAPGYKNNKITFFDMAQNKFRQIDFKDDCKYEHKFKGLVSFKNFVYFIPNEYPAIMRLNTETNEIEYFSDWFNEAHKLYKPMQEAWKNIIFCDFTVAYANLALAIQGSNAIMFFNMETGAYEIKNIGEKIEQYATICFDGQNYCISSYYKDYIIKWNKETNKTSKNKFPPSFSRKDDKNCNFIIKYLNEHIWLLPIAANNAYKINTKTNELTELPELVKHFGGKKLDWHYNFAYTLENTIYASTMNKGIAEYNVNTRELNFIKPSNYETDLLFFDCENEIAKTITENAGEKIWEHFASKTTVAK
jgi:hypothetical protein